jgi:hypothetical protein
MAPCSTLTIPGFTSSQHGPYVLVLHAYDASPRNQVQLTARSAVAAQVPPAQASSYRTLASCRMFEWHFEFAFFGALTTASTESPSSS